MMDHICWMVPLYKGKTQAAREYCIKMETTRRAEFEASEQAIGIAREVFFLWERPEGDYIVLYMSGDDMEDAMKKWDVKNDEFERWGKAEWANFSNPADWPQPIWARPGNPPVLEVLSAYDETEARA